MEAGYVMPVSGRVTHGGLNIAYPRGADIYDVNVSIVTLYVNVSSTNHHISTGVRAFDEPLELNQGDILLFRSAATIPTIGVATVNVLIELDL